MVANDLKGERMPRRHVDIFQGSRAPLYDTTVESINHQSTGHKTVRVSSEVCCRVGVITMCGSLWICEKSLSTQYALNLKLF